jgi:signal transduction histidine kinase
MTSWFRGYLLYVTVFLIAFLILGDIYLIRRNNSVITFNKEQQEQAEKVKVSTSDVIRSLHLLDLAIRSYAFLKNEHFTAAMDSAVVYKNAALYSLEVPLKAQNYPMEKFYAFRDSIESYLEVARHMVDLIDKNDQSSFVRLLEMDPGYQVWLQYLTFSKDVHAFEDNIATQAKERYERAVNDIYVLQVLLFFIAVPTLAYTAYYTNRTLSVSEQLRKSEQEKSAILAKQNLLLEKTVHERTHEILAQNEEITSQNEEISLHNEKLLEAKNIIESQNRIIQQKNDELAIEVQRQTQSLIQANAELTEHNERLEQFAFIISHNLRAPMSRIIGLSSILDFTKDATEVADIAKLMTRSTQDLDQIIKELSDILGVQKMTSQVMDDVLLDKLINKVTLGLQLEIAESNGSIVTNFSKAESVKGIPGYVESILFNLISNAIKYRDPDKKLAISIESSKTDDYTVVVVADNGLGIDLGSHRENLFNLYKRFHFHVDGRGVGLYLVKTQITALGGKVDVDSTPGEGTVFTLWFKQGPAIEPMPAA